MTLNLPLRLVDRTARNQAAYDAGLPSEPFGWTDIVGSAGEIVASLADSKDAAAIVHRVNTWDAMREALHAMLDHVAPGLEQSSDESEAAEAKAEAALKAAEETP